MRGEEQHGEAELGAASAGFGAVCIDGRPRQWRAAARAPFRFRVRVWGEREQVRERERGRGARVLLIHRGEHCSSDEGVAGTRGRELGSLQRGHCGDREEEDAVF